jgi:hypothetical protein
MLMNVPEVPERKLERYEYDLAVCALKWGLEWRGQKSGEGTGNNMKMLKNSLGVLKSGNQELEEVGVEMLTVVLWRLTGELEVCYNELALEVSLEDVLEMMRSVPAQVSMTVERNFGDAARDPELLVSDNKMLHSLHETIHFQLLDFDMINLDGGWQGAYLDPFGNSGELWEDDLENAKSFEVLMQRLDALGWVLCEHRYASN